VALDNGKTAMRIGLIVNPIAGMGGRVGLKGTDNLYLEALRRGAEPVSPLRARRFIARLAKLGVEAEIYTARGIMGGDYLRGTPLRHEIVYTPGEPTTPEDTERLAEILSRIVDIIIFVGGDGTARDVCRGLREETPVLGVPSGVKMYSPCFAVSPEAAATVIAYLGRGEAVIGRCEVLDLDEELYRRGILEIRRYCEVRCPRLEGYIQGGKSFTEAPEEEMAGIAQTVIEEMTRDTYYVTGPGRTVKKIHELLGIPYTPLGFDIIRNRRLVARDVDEETILRYTGDDRLKIVISPVGGTGFLLGRGNQVVTGRVLTRIDPARDIAVVSTRSKLRGLRCLYIDLDDPDLIPRLPRVVRVVVGYHEYMAIPICSIY